MSALQTTSSPQRRSRRRRVRREGIGHTLRIMGQRPVPALIEHRPRQPPPQAMRAGGRHADAARGGGDGAGFEQGNEEAPLLVGRPVGAAVRGRRGGVLVHRRG